MTKSRKPDYSKIDIHVLLEQRRQVAVIWGSEDILAVRPDLTDDQAWAVLKECDRRHDCTEGFTWDFIEIIADDLFPRPDDSQTGENEDQP
jgi:hypothetical protein